MFEQRKLKLAALALAAGLAFIPTPALAYMGAGAGLSAIGSILSFLGVFLLMLLGFVWYPVKRFIGRFRSEEAHATAKADSIEASDEQE